MPARNSRNNDESETSYMFKFFACSPKINNDIKSELSEEIGKKIDNYDPKLQVEPSEYIDYSKHENKIHTELPDNPSENNYKYEMSENRVSDNKSARYSARRNQRQSEAPKYFKPRTEANPNAQYARPVQPTPVPQTVKMTDEEIRSMKRETLSKLEELVDDKGIILSRNFTMADTLESMEDELQMQRNKAEKRQKVKFYKQVLLSIVSGAELFNDKYNPFEFKLKDWSKQVASDMDDYTDVLGEIYEKYRSNGSSRFGPEFRLLFMIVISAVSFQISKAMFGENGLGKQISNNPNIVKSLMSGLTSGGSNMFKGNDEPPSNLLLQNLKKHNMTTETTVKSERSERSSRSDTESDTKYKKLLDEQNKIFEHERQKLLNTIHNRDKAYVAQIDDLRDKLARQSEKMNNISEYRRDRSEYNKSEKSLTSENRYDVSDNNQSSERTRRSDKSVPSKKYLSDNEIIPVQDFSPMNTFNVYDNISDDLVSSVENILSDQNSVFSKPSEVKPKQSEKKNNRRTEGRGTRRTEGKTERSRKSKIMVL